MSHHPSSQKGVAAPPGQCIVPEVVSDDSHPLPPEQIADDEADDGTKKTKTKRIVADALPPSISNGEDVDEAPIPLVQTAAGFEAAEGEDKIIEKKKKHDGVAARGSHNDISDTEPPLVADLQTSRTVDIDRSETETETATPPSGNDPEAVPVAPRREPSNIRVIEAALVEDKPAPPIYDAILVMGQSEVGVDAEDPPFWKRHKVALAIAVVAVVLFGGLMAFVAITRAPKDNEVVLEESVVESQSGSLSTTPKPDSVSSAPSTDPTSVIADSINMPTDWATTATTAMTNPTMALDYVDYCITVNIRTDDFGKEKTSWQLATKPTDGSDPQLLYSVEKGNLANNHDYSNTFCVREGTYTFTIFDDDGGLCCGNGRGYYAIELDGEVIVYGAVFDEMNRTHDILAGFNPTNNARDLEWLDEHNIRREAYHNENNVTYRRLVWSPSLARDAEASVDSIVALGVCRGEIDVTNTGGENLIYYTENVSLYDEMPANTLTSWSDNKADQGYPANLTNSQVMWRATRYLGCADKIGVLPNNKYCYVGVCRYVTAGNCNMGAYKDKSIPVLLNRLECGPVCPNEGCY